MNMAGNTMESMNKQASDTHLKSALYCLVFYLSDTIMGPSVLKVSLSSLTRTKTHDVQRANCRLFGS